MTRQDFVPLAEFVKKHYPPAAKWGNEVLLDYICWAANNDFLFIVRDKDESIKAAALARQVSCVPKTETEFDRVGKTIFVDCMVAESRKAFQLLCLTILSAFRTCDTVMFQRLDRGEKIKAYKWDHVRNTICKIKN